MGMPRVVCLRAISIVLLASSQASEDASMDLRRWPSLADKKNTDLLDSLPPLVSILHLRAST